MTAMERRLGEVEPRERTGARTGRMYEYQYERTARATLDLLADSTKHICVYCDWHDDYVIEIGDPPTRYLFHQVKGRKSSVGPWKFREFFGVGLSAKPSKRPASAQTKAVVPHMLLHYANFGNTCAGIVFVTNAGLDLVLSRFLETVAGATDLAALPPAERIAFDHIARAYTATSPPLTVSPEELFTWIRELGVHTDQGQIESADAALLEIADVVFSYSEIDLSQRQAKQIAREIVNQVRGRVAHSRTVVPASDELLRRDKGIEITDLLSVLSLSTQAYEALKAGAGRDAVKTLSRLQRFCKKHGMEKFIVEISEFKARWDVWRTIERHNVSSIDFLMLEEKAHEILKGDLALHRVGGEAKDVARQFESIGVGQLTPEEVMGLIFATAAQAEAL